MTKINPNQEQLTRLQEAFREIKAENDPLFGQPESDIFVRTGAYQRVQKTHRPLIVGRKGSGKTALILGYERDTKEDYLASAKIDVVADVFPVQILFAFFYADYEKARTALSRRHQSLDLLEYVEPSKVAAYAWLQSLRCSAIYVTAGALLDDSGELFSDGERKQLRRARAHIHSLFAGGSELSADIAGSEVVFSLLVYFFQSVQSAIDKVLAIGVSDISITLASITRAFIAAMSPRLDESIKGAVAVIDRFYETNGRKVLVTLDKFDDFYDDFYKNNRKTTNTGERQIFLSTLLQGLVIAVRDLNRDHKFRWLDTLIAVPLDKFLELHLRERADLEYSQMLRLNWTPVELFEYVNRRIRYALGDKFKSIEDPWYSIFPVDIANAKLKEVREDSFLYIVRHTLWRPREVQMFVSAILEEMERSRSEATEGMIRRVVRQESQKIIKREFYEEFLGEYPSLLSIMRKLENVDISSVMSYEDVCDKLAGVRVFEDIGRPDEVMLRLFHMGVVGVRDKAVRRREDIDASVTQHREEVVYRFSYNCELHDPFTQGTTVVFHPMFFEFLNIRHEEKYVVNQLTWDMFAA